MRQNLASNNASRNMGRETTQMFATLSGGMTRHTPEGVASKQWCETVGFQQAVAERDQGDLVE